MNQDRPLVLLRADLPGAAETNRRLMREHRAEMRADRRRQKREAARDARAACCALCSQAFRPFRPWPDQIDPVPVCHACTRDVPVRMSAQ
jgi:hypothetical protein